MKHHINNMKTYSLLLDDFREPRDCLNYLEDPRYGTRDWVIARTHDEFVGIVQSRWAKNEFPELVSLDHDLAAEHYDPSMYHGVDAYNDKAKEFKEKTGLDSAKFFIQFCIDVSIELPECLVHSMNPAGKERIKQTLYPASPSVL